MTRKTYLDYLSSRLRCLISSIECLTSNIIMEELKNRARDLLQKLNLDEKRKKVRELEAESSHPDFWQDNRTAAAKMKELALLQKEIENAEYVELLIDEDASEELESMINEMEKTAYLSGLYDKGNAILSIHAGQGGVDAMDWASMLFRMYSRYFERKGWKFEEIDFDPGEEAGIKSVSIAVEGDYAYGYLKGEQGVHRLVRLSPFNADQLRHTSFALVEVLPQVEEVTDVDIKEEDLEWEFYRASSHGGQNVQKVSSAVRLKHKPTGIVVTSQTERYQNQNREYALKHLKAKLWALQQEKRRQEEKEMKGEYQAPSWGNQIRNYVLHPYQMVKDTRTKVETGNVEAVLDGDLDQFVEAELKI